MPHFDDELFNACSFLLTYKGPIDLFFSHQGDCITEEMYSRDIQDLTKVLSELDMYRTNKGFGKISVKAYPAFEDVDRIKIKSEWHQKLCSMIESELKNNEIEYFIIPSPSIHQSHQQCYQIGKSMLRAPYISNIQNILIGTYYVDKITPNDLTSSPCIFIPMTEEEKQFAIKLLGYYNKNHAIDSENLNIIFSYDGFRCCEKAAQGFYPYYSKLKL